MRRKTNQEFLNDLNECNPAIRAIDEYINSSTRLSVECTKCGYIWTTNPLPLLKGSGCPKCAGNQTKTTQGFRKEMAGYNPYIEIVGEYKNSHTPIKVRCTICDNIWDAVPYRLLQGGQCNNCIKPHTSFMEQFILIAFQKQLGSENVISRDLSAIGIELDIYLPEYRLAFEPGTWLYHSKKVDGIDSEKRRLCAENKIRLITIYDTYPKDTAPPYKNDCYVFSGFLNEPGYNRLIELTKKLLLEVKATDEGLNWNQIANEAYEACHYNANDTFKEKLKAVAPNIELLEAYKGSHTPIYVRSTLCNHPKWKARPYTLIKGIGCPLCGREIAANNRKRKHFEFVSELREISPTLEVLGHYTAVTDRIMVKCLSCDNTWEPLAYSLLTGKGCPHCSAKVGAKKRKNKLAVKTTIQFVEEIKLINPDLVIMGDYINNKTKIDVKCIECGHEWKVVPASLLNGHGCPKCARRRKTKKDIASISVKVTMSSPKRPSKKNNKPRM